MKHLISILAAISVISFAYGQNNDWQNTGRYAEANAKLEKAPDVVFMGNSITEAWANMDPEFFTSHNFAGRGISGQVTTHMLARFRADVVDLAPKAVVILAGINDIAQNNGYISVKHTFDNIVSMAEIAKANKINVVLCTLVPADKIPWRKEIDPIPLVAELNGLIKAYAAENRIPVADYYSVMADANSGIRDELRNETKDAVHPGIAGYKVMEQEVLKVLKMK